jgi:hypothetical protein
MNARDMLLALGTPPSITTIAIPYLWFLPGAVDPDAQGVMEIVKAAQRGLRKIGFSVLASGVMDRPTADAMDRLFPPRGTWTSTSWVVVLDRIHQLMRAGKKFSPTQPGRVGMQGLGAFYGYGPLPGRMVGLPPGPLGLGATAVDSGVMLEFGLGVKDPTNVIPVPKDSGPTFNAFVSLQRQLNRMLSTVSGGGRVSEDGIIGSGVKKGMDKLATGLPLKIGNTVAIAEKAVSWGAILKSIADKKGVGATTNKGSSASIARSTEPAAPPLSEADRRRLSTAGFFSFLNQLPGGKFLPFIALGVGAAWFAVQQRKKRAS